MKNKLIELVLKFSGLGKVLEKVNGYKTYLGGLVSMLSGAGMVLTNAACIVNKALETQGLGDLLDLAKSIPDDPCGKAVLVGCGLVGIGLGQIGQRHATEKALKPA